MTERLTVYLADLAHTQSVRDEALTVPLNLGYIKAYAVAHHGAAVDIRLFKHPERLLAAVAETPPDVVGFSNYGWNNNLNRAIGRHLRTALPNALIVAGGPNIDSDPGNRRTFLDQHDYLDFVIVDGGEEPFAELLAWRLAGSDRQAELPDNLFWRNGDSIGTSPKRPLLKVIKGIPSPYLDGYLDEFLAAGMVPMFETNRGCPFRCTFCA